MSDRQPSVKNPSAHRDRQTGNDPRGVTDDQEKRARLKRLAIAAASMVGVVALIVASIVWPGYDQLEAPPKEISVWALNNAQTKYGRVNTQISEMESVASVSNPTTVIQRGSTALLVADGARSMSVINQAMPEDLQAEDASGLVPTPSGTTSVQAGGDRILFVASDGTLTSAIFEDPANGFQVMAPKSEESEDQSGEETQAEPLRVSAASITPKDTIVALMPEVAGEYQVLEIDGVSGKIATTHTGHGDLGESTQVAQVDGRWVVMDVESTSVTVYVQGLSEGVQIDGMVAPLLRASGTGGVLIADSGGLFEVDPGSGEVTKLVSAVAGSVASQPTQIADVTYAAWLATGGGPGVMWSSASKETTTALDYGGKQLETAPQPRILSNGDRTIVNDVASGWIWEAPEGVLVPTSQDWQADAVLEDHTVDAEVEEVLEPKPPVAMPDNFGVRAGMDTVLPVLLNDYDPNDDVLSIDAASLTQLDPSFGSLSLTNNGQQLVVSVPPGASGTATFSYKATDGTATDGLLSAAAAVILTVIPESENQKPFFAGIGLDDYLGEWPTPVMSPGQTVSIQVLSDWIDPDGDPIFLAGASSEDPRVQVLSNPGGTVTVRHTDADGDDMSPVSVAVTVSDTNGESETKPLSIQLSQSPPMTMTATVVEGVVDSAIEVDLTQSVSGGSGALAISEVESAAGEESLRLTPAGNSLRFTATASAPGSYPVRVTVVDAGGATITGVVRLVVLPVDQARIATTPVTVFIRPSEDTTIDLMSTISNPSSSVLLISDLVVEPAGNAELSAELVGQQLVHATGRTADDAPGFLGTATYSVSDGSTNANMTARGVISFMLADSDDAYPIAGDRWITVSAGTQVDIPVLDWATAPVGAQLAVDQASVAIDQRKDESDTSVGLAFATPALLRYLAPTKPGEYSISYTIFRMGNPALNSTGSVNVVVAAEEVEELSTPATLVGRVLAGNSVTIPLSLSEARMRGETYVLDAVTAQPTRGTAAVSADGQSLTYTAHPGDGGQDTFSYQVRTASGRTAVGRVKVGVLDATVSPAPVLYSRYLQMAVGADNQVSIYPLDNAVDPAGGVLTLMEVWPNEPEGTDEFMAASRRIQADLETGEVMISGATSEGSSSFFYKANNERGDQATGMIVIKSIQNPTKDFPVVADTRLTAENLSQLPSGVDVLTDKTSWSTGPAGDLKMELWGSADGFAASGSSISGPVPDKATVVPFQVSGTSFQGEDVVSYGFLKVPAMKDVPPALRSTFTGMEVPEEESGTVDLADIIVDPMKEGLRFDGPEPTPSGARAEAQCSISGTILTYTAGAGAPWQDACAVSVRTDKSQEFTVLSVPVTIVPKEPQPVLRAASVEASPGSAAVTYDLMQMVDWQGGREGTAELYVSGTPSLFSITQQGSFLTVTANTDATPTRVETVQVLLSNYPDVVGASLTLTVGPAAGDAPRGGVARQDCTSAGGNTSCSITVVGASVQGQTNFAPEVALSLVEGTVVSPANCPSVTFSYESSTTVKASWNSDTPGRADCTGSFVVQDAQGRQSRGADAGQILLNLQGLPPTPQVTWKEATPDSVTFQVGVQGESYPAVESFSWSGAGEGTCPLTGNCTISIPTSSLGESKSFEFKAISKVGSSAAATATAWTYRPPSAPRIESWEPNTDGTSVSMKVTADAADTSKLTVEGTTVSETIPQGTGTSSVDLKIPMGTVPTDVVVKAHARLDKPPETVVVPEAGSATASRSGVHAVGAPAIDVTVTVPEGMNEADISVSVAEANGVGGAGTSMRHQVCYTVQGSPEVCEMPRSGSSSTFTVYGIGYGRTITAKATAWGQKGETKFPTGTKTKETAVGVPAAPAGKTYSIRGEMTPCEPGADAVSCYQWSSVIEPTFDPLPSSDLQRVFFFSADGLMFESVAAAVESMGFPQDWPLLKVRNEAGTFKSDPQNVALAGPGPAQVRLIAGTGEICPASVDTLIPIKRTSTQFGSMAPKRTEDIAGEIHHIWKLNLPTGFTAGSIDQFVEWRCYVPAPPEEIEPPEEG